MNRDLLRRIIGALLLVAMILPVLTGVIFYLI